MGCISAKDLQAQVTDTIIAITVQTGIIEFDQIFLLISEVLKEAEDIRLNCIPSRVNMFAITKVHLMSQPNLIDAYKVWTWAVSLCNKGESKGNTKFTFNKQEEFDKKPAFEYNLGKCGDARLFWFGKFLSDYIKGVFRAQKLFPSVKQKVKDMFERIIVMRNDIFKYAQYYQGNEKYQVIAKVAANIAALGRGVQVVDAFEKHLNDYVSEVNQLYDKHSEIESEADKTGKEVYHKLDVIHLEKSDDGEPDLFRIKNKINFIVLNYLNGKKPRTADEEAFYKKIKEDRAKGKPKQLGLEHYAFGEHEFPYKLRWTGCTTIDLPIAEMSVALEDLNTQKTDIFKSRILIRNLTQTYKLKKDHMIEAWKIFIWAAGAEQGSLSRKGVCIKNQFPVLFGHDKVNYTNEQLKQLHLYFKDYLLLIPPLRIDALEAQWQKFNEQFKVLIKDWSEGDFINQTAFRQVSVYNQYNIMTNLAKNIYLLKSYRPQAKKLYEKKYKKRIEEAKEFFEQANKVIEEADPKIDPSKNIKLEELITVVHKGDKASEEKINKKKKKIDEFLAKLPK